ELREPGERSSCAAHREVDAIIDGQLTEVREHPGATDESRDRLLGDVAVRDTQERPRRVEEQELELVLLPARAEDLDGGPAWIGGILKDLGTETRHDGLGEKSELEARGAPVEQFRQRPEPGVPVFFEHRGGALRCIRRARELETDELAARIA